MDVLGLTIGVVVLAGSAHDNAAGTVLLDQAAKRRSDAGYAWRRPPCLMPPELLGKRLPQEVVVAT